MTTSLARYSSREVADAAGITYRRLDYWCRIGLVRSSLSSATGSGSRRGFSAHDAAVVGVVAALAGWVPLARLEELVGFLDDLPLAQWAHTTVILSPHGDVWVTAEDSPKVGIHVDLSLVFDPPEVVTSAHGEGQSTGAR